MSNTISVDLNQDELNALVSLIDAGVKATGLNGAKIAVIVMGKLEEAINKVNSKNSQKMNGPTPNFEDVEDLDAPANAPELEVVE